MGSSRARSTAATPGTRPLAAKGLSVIKTEPFTVSPAVKAEVIAPIEYDASNDSCWVEGRRPAERVFAEPTVALGVVIDNAIFNGFRW
jgi:hypothetical protein